MPKVSICVPVYNMADYVGLAVQSALEQSFKDFEIIVCNNASTDNTAEVLSKFDDPRLKVITNETNIGMIRNFNLTVELAEGEYIKFLEADDLLLPGCLERGVKIFGEYPEIGIVSFGRIVIDRNGAEMARKKQPPGLVSGREILNQFYKRGNQIGTPTDVMIKRDLFMQNGMFDLDYKSYLNDFAFWLKCCATTDVYFSEDYLTEVREHTARVGSTGARSNIDIEVNLLMTERLFCGDLLIDHRLIKKTIVTLEFFERYFWRGFIQMAQAVSNKEIKVFLAWKELFRNLKLPYIVLGIPYTFLRSPYYLLRRILPQVARKIKAKSV